VEQIAGGQFPLVLQAQNFSVAYKWHEAYHEYFCATGGRFPSCHGSDNVGDYDYIPGIGLLNTTVTLAFEFNSTTKTYDIKVKNTSGKAANVSANIPGRSVIQNEDTGCFTAKVSDATAAAVSTINFEKAIAAVIPPLLKSIAGSGDLTPDIHYDFGLGDSGLTFPADNKGIKIGVTGKVRYKDQEYPGAPPPPVPVPPPPLDANHVNVYVSDYEINALHWAYFQAGLLNITITPSQLPDPDVLKVKTYVGLIPELKPYAAFAMNATVSPKEPPVAKFQEVYEFTTDAMALLNQQLPSDVYQMILNIEGNGYVSKEDLEGDLAALEVPTQWNETIERATKAMGMVTRQDIKFTLIIQNGAPQQPDIVFSVIRTDILTNLGLGITNNAQTMKYRFKKVKSEATFISSTIPRFPGNKFADIIWPIAGEMRYSETLNKLGDIGVPIPIMQGFRFLFDNAKLSIQSGFVSILAEVTYKTAAEELALAAAGRG
jgi:LBP / BPI / CETP family, C-terminal domain